MLPASPSPQMKPDEKAVSAVAFRKAAIANYGSLGVAVSRVMTRRRAPRREPRDSLAQIGWLQGWTPGSRETGPTPRWPEPDEGSRPCRARTALILARAVPEVCRASSAWPAADRPST